MSLAYPLIQHVKLKLRLHGHYALKIKKRQCSWLRLHLQLNSMLRTMIDLRTQLHHHIETLPPEQIKTVLQKWVEGTDLTAQALEQMFIDMEEIDNHLETVYRPLAEEEIVRQGLMALEQYQKTGRGISQQEMKVWAAKLGTDHEGPCPINS